MCITRKIAVITIAFFYLCGICPGLMFLYNKAMVVAGLPLFIVGLLLVCLGMLSVTLILYLYEYRGKKAEDNINDE